MFGWTRKDGRATASVLRRKGVACKWLVKSEKLGCDERGWGGGERACFQKKRNKSGENNEWKYGSGVRRSPKRSGVTPIQRDIKR